MGQVRGVERAVPLLRTKGGEGRAQLWRRGKKRPREKREIPGERKYPLHIQKRQNKGWLLTPGGIFLGGNRRGKDGKKKKVDRAGRIH